MDRPGGPVIAARALAVAGALHAACAGSAPRGVPLAPGEIAAGAAVGLDHRAALASGVLAYAAAIADDTAITVELATGFELVARPLPATRPARRVALGPPGLDVEALAVEPGARRAWVASAAGTVRAIDLATGRIATTWHLGARGTAVAVTADGRYVATGTADGVLCLRRADGALLQCALAHQGRISGLAFHGVGPAARLASCAWDGGAAVWVVPTLAVVARRPARAHRSANDVAIAPDGARVALAYSRRPPVRSPARHVAERTGRAYTRPDPDAEVIVWRIDDHTATALRGHRGPVTAVAWTPDGARVVSGSWDRSVRMWDPETGTELDRYTRFEHLVRDVAIDARGTRAIVAAWTDGRDGPASVVLDLLYPTRLRLDD